MRIGLFGFDFVSSNKGCLALTYTFLTMVEKIVEKEENIDVINFSYNNSIGNIEDFFPNMRFSLCHIKLKNIKSLRNMKKKIKECDLFFDGTFGDGFSDIYGKKWNVVTDTIKQMVINQNVPLVLLPQTYGPFSSKFLEKWAVNIIKKSKLVYTRDNISAEYIKSISNIDIKLASDMAFKLPYDKTKYTIDNKKINIGINVSSLLWDSEWSKQNHFGLTVDYKEFHTTVIDYLIKNKNKYDIHIIPHVINLKEPNHRENDYRICNKLKEVYGDDIIIAPPFDNPVEAKSYISNMDIFIGSRMHATIASLSSNVATIPFSYSRKFEGLFGNIDYPYIISAKTITTQKAIENTINWINDYKTLEKESVRASEIAIKKLDGLEADIKSLFENKK